MGFGEELEDVEDVEFLQIDFDNDVSLKVTDLTAQIAKDYVHYKTINQSGWTFAPSERAKVDLATWFINRGCSVSFLCNPEKTFGWLHKFILDRQIKRLNKMLERGE